jgi:hypothetical protein
VSHAVKVLKRASSAITVHRVITCAAAAFSCCRGHALGVWCTTKHHGHVKHTGNSGYTHTRRCGRGNNSCKLSNSIAAAAAAIAVATAAAAAIADDDSNLLRLSSTYLSGCCYHPYMNHVT